MARTRFAVACVSERRRFALIQEALLGRVPVPVREHVGIVSGWPQLLEEVAHRPPAVVIFDIHVSGFGIRAVRRLREALPRAGILAWIPRGSGDPRLVMKLLAAGTDDVFVPTGRQPDIGALAEAVDDARTAGVTRCVLAGLDGVLPAALEPFMERLLRATVRPLDVSGAAQLNYSVKRTLRRHLAEARFPPPRIFVTWCRLFHAAYLLENRRRSVLNVALALDFPSPDALRQKLRRHAGVSPTEVRERGLAFLLESFVERHGDGRWGLHGS